MVQRNRNGLLKKRLAIAERNNATLNLVNIIDTRSYAAVEAYDRSIAERAQKFAEELLKEYKLEAEAAGVEKCQRHRRIRFTENNDFKDISKKLKADLIICGATGLNAVERFLIGSVSENIVRSAKCDVLVIRTPEEDNANK